MVVFRLFDFCRCTFLRTVSSVTGICLWLPSMRARKRMSSWHLRPSLRRTSSYCSIPGVKVLERNKTCPLTYAPVHPRSLIISIVCMKDFCVLGYWKCAQWRFWSDCADYSITKTCLFKYTKNSTSRKWKFSDKKILIFFIYLLKI